MRPFNTLTAYMVGVLMVWAAFGGGFRYSRPASLRSHGSNCRSSSFTMTVVGGAGLPAQMLPSRVFWPAHASTTPERFCADSGSLKRAQ
jgi:hypothetical protein